jgi:GAF domain-containing protein
MSQMQDQPTTPRTRNPFQVVGSWLVSPHPALETILERRLAQQTTLLSLVMLALILLGLFASISSRPAARLVVTFGPLVLIIFVSYVLSRSRLFRISGYLISFSPVIFAFLDLYSRASLTPADLTNTVLANVPVAFVIASALIPVGPLTLLVILSSVALVIIPPLQPAISFQQITQLAGMIFSTGSVLVAIVAYRNTTERRRLAEMQDINRELNQVKDTLEQQVAERTHELTQTSQSALAQAKQLAAISEVARAITHIQDLEELLTSITALISERFGFYHVGIFLVDEYRQYAVLRAANSLGGRRMLAHGHKLLVGQVGIVGFVSSTGEPRISLDVGSDAIFFDNPDLPETRSEMALPLKTSGTIIGVLDVQSEVESAFSQEDLNIMAILADQVTIAIENSKRYKEAQEALAESRAAFGESTRESWRAMPASLEKYGFRYREAKIEELDAPISMPELASLKDQPMVTDGDGGETILVPIRVRGENIGILHIQARTAGRHWTENELSIIRSIAERGALALENARLFRETTKRAQIESLLSDITAKMSASINLTHILQTTAEELGRAMPGSEVVVQLQTPQVKSQ